MTAISLKELQKLKTTYSEKNKKQLSIGYGTYGQPKLLTFDCNLQIGRFCSIAHNAVIMAGGDHDSHAISSYPFNIFFQKRQNPVKDLKRDTIIGNDVWIGHGATILGGVTVGHGAVIGAGCVVHKNIEPYEVVVGCPQTHLRYRFEEEDRERLLRLKWWDQPDELLVKLIPLLTRDDIDLLEETIQNYKE